MSTFYIQPVFHYVGRKKYKEKPTKKYIQYLRDNYDKLEYVPILSNEIWKSAFPDRPHPLIYFDRKSMPIWNFNTKP